MQFLDGEAFQGSLIMKFVTMGKQLTMLLYFVSWKILALIPEFDGIIKN